MGPEFDPLLLSQARLGIVSVLMTRPEATFSDLKSLLGMTQGNLGVHLRKLEEAGYVEVRKEFVDRKPDFYRLIISVDLRDAAHLHSVISALSAEQDVAQVERHQNPEDVDKRITEIGTHIGFQTPG